MPKSCSLALVAGLLTFGLAAPGVAGEPDVAYLYWAATSETGGIWRALATGDFPEQLIEPGVIGSVGVEPTGGFLYYPVLDDNDQGDIWRSDLDGNQRVVLVEGVAKVRDIEFDVAGGKIYWTDDFQIRRADLAGGPPETLVATSGPSETKALALDLEAGTMYFGSNKDVVRANLDGTGATILLDAGTAGPFDLEVDTVNDKLYISKPEAGLALRRCELDGTACTVLVSVAGGKSEIVGNTVYHNRLGDLWRVDLDGANPQQLSFGADYPQSFSMNPVNLQVYRPTKDISRSELDGSNRVAIVGAAGTEMHDVAVDPVTERFYFSDGGLRRVVGSPLEESVPLQVTLTNEGLSESRGLALDGTGRLYWADVRTAPGGGIWGIDADGTDREEILPDLNLPHDVAIDTVAGKIYWTDSVEDGNGTGVAIRRADLDGLNLETLLTNLSLGIRGIAVDAVGGKIYWTDHVADEISRANLDGSTAEVLPLVVANPHDVSVDSAAGQLYWTEGIAGNANPTGKIRRSNLDGTGATDILLGLSARIRDLVVVYHRRLPLFSDGFESGDTSRWSQTVP